jgi:PII-like signaling protein
MHKSHLAHSNRPITITVVDSAEQIGRLIPVVADMMDTGLMATSAVQMIRIQKTPAAPEGTGA